MGPRVLLLPADTTGCGQNRLIWPAQVLKERGYDVLVQETNQSMWASLISDKLGTERVVAAGVDGDVDVVVVQRPCSRVTVDSLPFIQRKRIRVVVELDDDLRSVDANNAAFHAVHPRFSPESNWQHLVRAISYADALVVTTPALSERYGKNTPTSVVPNYVPEWYLKVEGEKQGNVFGWPGNILSHPHDLQVMRPAIYRLMSEGFEFRVVGPEGVERLFPGTQSTGWTDDYANEVAKLDVGIAPLEDSKFNQAKSWLKPLEFAALGVPFVMSPSDEYLRLFRQHDVGALVGGSTETRAFVKRLLTRPDYRSERASYYREQVRSNGLTIEERAEEFWHGWTG